MTGTNSQISASSAAIGLEAFQHGQLCRAAEASGQVGDLLYYYAALRDEARLVSLAERALAGTAQDQLIYRLLRSDAEPARPSTVLDLAMGVADPWVIYTLVKFLLRKNRVSDALSQAVRAISAAGGDVVSLNLVGRFALYRGYPDIAKKVAERSIALAPEQQDVTGFLASLKAGELTCAPPCLDLPPPHWRVVYYLPCFNVEKYISQTIEAVASLCYPLEEILIIDDGSTDHSIAIAQHYPVRIVRHEKNKGLAAARNTAWRSTTADFLGTVDTDASPDPSYVRCALMEFEQARPALALTGGRLIEAYTDTPADEFRATYMGQDPGKARAYLGALAAPAAIENAGSFRADTGTVFVTGSDTLARRAALEAVGGYPERFRTNGEDAAMCERLRVAGWHVAYTPNCVATHYRRDTITSVLRTSWNYGFWHRTDNGFYANSTSLMRLLDDYSVAGHYFIMDSAEAKRTHLLYLEFLFTFFSMTLDLRHGVAIGVLTPGQARTVQQQLENNIRALDARFGGDLLSKVRQDLPSLDVPPGVEPEPLEPAAQEMLDGGLAQLRNDQVPYNLAFYQLLMET